jgi:hypothetical protein
MDVRENVCYIARLVLDLPQLQLMLQYSPSLLVYYNIIIMVFRNCCLAFVEGKLVCWCKGSGDNGCSWLVHGGCEILREPWHQVLGSIYAWIWIVSCGLGDSSFKS